MISDDATEKSREGQQQRHQSGLKSGGSWIRVKKCQFLQANFRKFSVFFQAILQKNIEFCRQISENFDFFRQLKRFDFQAKNCQFTATSGQIILFLFKSNHFRTYFLYMIRYNNISRPVHDSNDPLRPSLRPPAQNLVSRPSAPGLTPLDSNGKEAFSRRKELPSGRIEKNED